MGKKYKYIREAEKKRLPGGYPVYDDEILGLLKKQLSKDQRSLLKKILANKKFTAKLKRLIVYMSHGMSKNKAILKAGYRQQPQGYRALRNAAPQIQELMGVVGITDDSLVEHMNQGLKATKLHGEKYKEEVPDWTNRHRYLESAFRLKGHLKDPNQMQLNVGNIVLIRYQKEGSNGAEKKKVINAQPDHTESGEAGIPS